MHRKTVMKNQTGNKKENKCKDYLGDSTVN